MSSRTKMPPYTMDARAWADMWLGAVNANPDIASRKDTMIAWFSSAIMAGYDEAMRRCAKEKEESK